MPQDPNISQPRWLFNWETGTCSKKRIWGLIIGADSFTIKRWGLIGRRHGSPVSSGAFVGTKQEIEQKKSATELWKRDIPGEVTAVDFAPDDHSTLLGFDNGVVHFIDSQGNLAWEADVAQPVKDVKILPSRKMVAILNEYSQLIVIDYAGKLKLKKGFKCLWSGLGVKSGDILLWGWKTKPRRITPKGRTVKEYALPHPWLRVIPVTKKEQFWVVHNQVCLGLYESDGTNLWMVNNPWPMELSRDMSSDFAVSDTGGIFAISCFHKGVYLYDGINRKLSQLDLDTPVSHIDVSRNGKYILLSDQLGGVYMASKNAAVVWEKELHSPVSFCRIDRRGSRVLVGERNGTLSCFKFVKEEEKRSDFLELTSFHDIGDHKEIWNQPAHKVSNAPGTVRISGDGRYILLGDGKEFQLYDSAGSLIWVKHFMTRLTRFDISHNGKKVLLSSRTEMFLLDTQSLKEKHLTFYGAELKEVALAPSGNSLLAFDQFKTLTCYSGQGKKVWNRTLNKDIFNLRIHHRAQRAVFQSSPKVLFVLNLENLKLKHTTLGGPVTALELTGKGIFAGGEQGRCYGFDLDGRGRWKFKMEGPIRDIVSLNGSLGYRNKANQLALRRMNGSSFGDYRAHSSRSMFCQYKKETLELVAGGDMLSCFRVPSGDLVWRLPLDGTVQSMDVSETANRLVILDSQSLHYHQLIHEPHAVEDRTTFLEL